MALELWPVEGCDLILDRLEIAIDENCAPLIAALAEVRTETRDERIRSVLKQALEVRQVGVVKSTLKAIEALGYDDLHSDVLTCYRWWLTDGPQYPGPDDKIQIVEPNVAADILAHLSHAGKITMDDLHEACNSSRSDVRRVATQEIARMLDANDEWIESILDDIQAGQLPSGVLDELSRCYPQVCKRYEPTIMALLTSPDEVIRITVIRALGDGWCDDATAITTLRTMLNDVDIEVRDEATTILRELLNEPRIDD
jgi:hypothetical protein